VFRVITCNVNGIRAAAKKGFYDWLPKQKADVICLQEVRALPEQIEDEVFHPKGYHFYQCVAEKKGYSGVALYTREKPDKVQVGIGWDDFDAEGRYLQADFGKVSVVSLYIPSGSSGEPRQSIKYDYLERLKPWFLKCKRRRRQFVFCGDWNIAHKEIDLKNFKSNKKNSGFLPDERAWLDWLYDEAGYVDAFRGEYTWWSNRGQSWAKNVGWRLDYQAATPKLAATASKVSIFKDERFSDHAPLTIDYDFDAYV